MITGWEAHYSNGDVYSSASGDKWEDIPQENFEILVRFFPDKKMEMVTGQDLYLLDNSYEVKDKNIKKGKFMKDEDFWEIFDKVRDGLREKGYANLR